MAADTEREGAYKKAHVIIEISWAAVAAAAATETAAGYGATAYGK